MLEETLNVANHKCRANVSIASGIPMVFLHGYSYTSEIWKHISIMELLETKNLPFLFLDMPYGAKSQCQPHNRSIEANVAVVFESVKAFFGESVPLLIDASLGAHMSLQYAARHPVKGLLLVGATRVLEDSLIKAFNHFTFPVRLILGSEDRIASLEDYESWQISCLVRS